MPSKCLGIGTGPCGKTASYRYPNEQYTKCADHALIGMTKRPSAKKCDYKDEKGEKCKTQPSYAIWDFVSKKPKATRCKKHILPNMVDVASKMCIICPNNKKIQATYGVLGTKKATHCKDHAPVNFVNIKAKKCVHPGCVHQRNFAIKQGDKPTMCGEHAPRDWVNVTHKKCAHPGCGKEPTFGLRDEVTHCATHKTAEMKDTKNRKCTICKENVPRFGTEDGEITHCYKCKEEKMINLVSTRCEAKDCKTLASYGLKDGLITACWDHSTDDMINLKARRCAVCGTGRAYYAIKLGEKATHCPKCAKFNMVDVVNPRCKFPWCDTFISPKFQGYCRHHFVHLYPDTEISKNYRTKEKAVYDYIADQFPNDIPVWNKTIKGGSSTRRPDLYWDMKSHVVIVEIDEYKHQGYSCENKRMMELFQDAGSRPMWMIRFNPDGYGNKKSPWRDGRIIDKKDWEERLDKLASLINDCLDSKPIKEVVVMHLFYD